MSSSGLEPDLESALINLEGVPFTRMRDLDSDLVVGYGGQTREQFTADPVYSTMPAVAAGAIAWLDDESLVSATSATVLNIPWQLDRLVPLLTAAARA